MVTNGIVLVTVAATFLAWRSPRWADAAVFYPLDISVGHQYYRFLSYGLVHADVWHVLFNMFALWSFGTVAETVLEQLLPGTGAALYLAFYVSALAISIWPSYRRHRKDPEYVSLGASGAVSAVLAFTVLIDPFASVYVYAIPMPGWVFLIAYIVISAWLSRRPGSRVNHSAHLVGTLYGVVALVILGALFNFNVLYELVSGILS